jgi:hypothetical protein
MKYTNLLQKLSCLTFAFAICSSPSLAQMFQLPAMPQYDSIYVDSYQNVIHEKIYFNKGKRVLEIGYNTGDLLYSPFATIGGSQEDSCYAYFNGPEHEAYDFYYMAKTYIVNERYAENSKLFHYQKSDWNNNLIEQGDYYFTKEMYEGTITHNRKYKIGKWTTYASGKPKEVIDYEKLTVNGKPIKFEGQMKIIDSLKTLADKKIIDVYGKAFFNQYVKFNLDRSGYYPYARPRPEQPDGYSLLIPSQENIEYVDLSYDILINNEHFNVFQFRISRKGEFLGRTHYPDFAAEYFYLTIGLDSLNNGKLHKSILNWKQIAADKGLDVNSKKFNVRFDFHPTSDFYGELRLVLEQITSTTSTPNSYTNHLKQYFINPWTGEITEAKDEQGIQSIMMDSFEGM